MTKQEIYELVKKAYESNEFKKLFLGDESYSFSNLKHIPANVPTDVGAIIDKGIYKLYVAGNTDVASMLVKTIYDLLNLNNAFSTWTAYFVLRYQYRNEIKEQSPFKIVTPKLCDDIRSRVHEQRDQLVACKEYVGFGLTNGLWEDIQRLENVMLCNYGVSIL